MEKYYRSGQCEGFLHCFAVLYGKANSCVKRINNVK